MHSDDLSTSLNNEQYLAVTAELGNMLVLAGAGSGKTKVLINRIYWLIKEMQQSASSILAVTFTNKAAAEMRARLQTTLGIEANRAFVGTFHGLAHQMLRKHYLAANLPSNFQILTSQDQLKLIKKIIVEKGYDPAEIEPRDIQNFINKLKDELIVPANNKMRDLKEKICIDVYNDYEKQCGSAGLVDFGEILKRCYQMLVDNADLLAEYRSKYKHFLIDEFQDTNTVQYKWMRLLSMYAASMFVVGDDDQSIYGWRGAKIENISKYQTDYHDVKIVRLEQNYRSTGNILKAANALISNNKDRLGKQLWTSDIDGHKISLFGAINEQEEAMYIAKTIENYIQSGLKFSDIAILYRSNAQSRVIEEALVSKGMPYKIYGGLRFFERAEIKDILAYLRLGVSNNDDLCFERIINTPPRGIGTKTLDAINQYATTHGISLFDASNCLINAKLLTSRAESALRTFIELIKSLTGYLDRAKDSLTDILEFTIKTSGLLEYLSTKKDLLSENRIENLQELLNATKDFNFEYQDEYKVNPVVEFLSYTSLDDVEIYSDNSVQMMTIHSSKGLEYPVVFLCGMEENLFPHHLSTVEDKLQEERRLCYVGITRAKNNLHLTFANMRRVFGDLMIRKSSRFIKEIPESLLDCKGKLASSIPLNNKINSRTPSAFNKVVPSHSVFSDDVEYVIGEQVVHQKFGRGVIKDIVGDGDKAKVQIYFNAVGTKWLLLSYAKLSKIG